MLVPFSQGFCFVCFDVLFAGPYLPHLKAPDRIGVAHEKRKRPPCSDTQQQTSTDNTP